MQAFDKNEAFTFIKMNWGTLHLTVFLFSGRKMTETFEIEVIFISLGADSNF